MPRSPDPDEIFKSLFGDGLKPPSYVNPQADQLSVDRLYTEYQRAVEQERYARQHEPRDRYDEWMLPPTRNLVEHLCQTDREFEYVWRKFTGRVRSGLTDTIVRAFVEIILDGMKRAVVERDSQNERHLAETRRLGTCIHDLIRAYERASIKGDLDVLTPVVEEADALMEELFHKPVLE